MHFTTSTIRHDTPAIQRAIRHAIHTFDSRYAMYLRIYGGDSWEALGAALLTALPAR